ncbi:MAG: c-type cytochrome [Bacteroidetes bacterium]|nr:c-type cytochrome [Bacteroidota bacterium]MBS1931219.1 c-type cytochrome [Bacteroidota bacterium]
MRNLFQKHSILTALIIFLFSGSAYAQNNISFPSGGMKYFFYSVLGFLILAIIFTAYFIKQRNKYRQEALLRTGKPMPLSGFRKLWSNFDKKFFTKAASIEKESDVLLDHDYDGIKELDNTLPPWWKWGFYLTIIVAVIYLLRFHVFKTGPTPEQEYNNEMQIAATKIEANKSKNKIQLDENNVTMADATGIAEGKKIYSGTCFPCHGAQGEGGIGPNLTDKYWLHGGSIHNIFKTITDGVPDKGMQAWGKTFTPEEIRDLSSFVLSLQGTNPPNAKAPQGDLYVAAKASDSVAVKKDTIKQKPAK